MAALSLADANLRQVTAVPKLNLLKLSGASGEGDALPAFTTTPSKTPRHHSAEEQCDSTASKELYGIAVAGGPEADMINALGRGAVAWWYNTRDSGRTALHVLAEDGNLSALVALISRCEGAEHRAEVVMAKSTATQSTVVHSAAMGGHAQCVKYLLELSGVDHQGVVLDGHGNTLLHREWVSHRRPRPAMPAPRPTNPPPLTATPPATRA